ncbi:MAG: hypothetical protein KatS3mg100_705 [Candidatus Parcubacteria bacterium]|nr:MAG: hypothetical protein KatS3mg100_705 [Candidatus Parcubacteria bacterium]
MLFRLTRDASHRWLPQGYFTRKEFATVYPNQGADYALHVLENKGFVT